MRSSNASTLVNSLMDSTDTFYPSSLRLVTVVTIRAVRKRGRRRSGHDQPCRARGGGASAAHDTEIGVHHSTSQKRKWAALRG